MTVNNAWIVPSTINDCEVTLAIMVNRERGEFVVAFSRKGGSYGTAIYKSGLEYWLNGRYGFETETDAHCDAIERARS